MPDDPQDDDLIPCYVTIRLTLDVPRGTREDALLDEVMAQLGTLPEGADVQVSFTEDAA